MSFDFLKGGGKIEKIAKMSPVEYDMVCNALHKHIVQFIELVKTWGLWHGALSLHKLYKKGNKV